MVSAQSEFDKVGPNVFRRDAILDCITGFSGLIVGLAFTAAIVAWDHSLPLWVVIGSSAFAVNLAIAGGCLLVFGFKRLDRRNDLLEHIARLGASPEQIDAWLAGLRSDLLTKREQTLADIRSRVHEPRARAGDPQPSGPCCGS